MSRKKISRESKKGKNLNKEIDNYCENFYALLRQAENPALGTYEIEIAEVLTVELFPLAPTIAIIEDAQGKIWSIPEGDGNSTKKNAIISRWGIWPGMKLRVEVTPSDELLSSDDEPPLSNKVTVITIKE